MTKATFILGPAGTGKSYICEKYSKLTIDKDDLCKDFTNELLKLNNQSDIENRDSEFYKVKLRDMEYAAALGVAKNCLAHKIDVLLPGPWTKELKQKDFISKMKERLNTKEVRAIYLTASVDFLYQRIKQRNAPRDAWKMQNWQQFSKTLAIPQEVIEMQKSSELEIFDVQIYSADYIVEYLKYINCDNLSQKPMISAQLLKVSLESNNEVVITHCIQTISSVVQKEVDKKEFDVSLLSKAFLNLCDSKQDIYFLDQYAQTIVKLCPNLLQDVDFNHIFNNFNKKESKKTIK